MRPEMRNASGTSSSASIRPVNVTTAEESFISTVCVRTWRGSGGGASASCWQPASKASKPSTQTPCKAPRRNWLAEVGLNVMVRPALKISKQKQTATRPHDPPRLHSAFGNECLCEQARMPRRQKQVAPNIGNHSSHGKSSIYCRLTISCNTPSTHCTTYTFMYALIARIQFCAFGISRTQNLRNPPAGGELRAKGHDRYHDRHADERAEYSPDERPEKHREQHRVPARSTTPCPTGAARCSCRRRTGSHSA